LKIGATFLMRECAMKSEPTRCSSDKRIIVALGEAHKLSKP
jgi:hypothetical protein